MPSSAFASFRENCVDVQRLIETHSALNDGNPGRKGLGHLTRSGAVMLCAAWELYAESLLVEAAKYLVSRCSSPDQLPLSVQKNLAKHVRDSKHELKPLMLSGDGWKQVLTSHAELLCVGLHTPKAGTLNELYIDVIGLERVSDSWPCGADELNKFVGVRGDIAHRGRAANYVKIWELQTYLQMIDTAAVATDNSVSEHLVSVAPGGYKPWNITA